MLKTIGRKAIRISLPFWLANFEAFILEKLPSPLLTRDQLKLLKIDNIIDGSYNGFECLGIDPTALEIILPTYLNRFCASSSRIRYSK